MPLMDFNDPATWAHLYDPPFERDYMERVMGDGLRDAASLRRALEAVGMKPTDAVALIGGGYGWVAEEWMAAGYASVIVCDTSTHIQNGKAKHARVTVHAEDGMSPGSQGRIRAALARDKVDWVVTEDVLPCLDDDEIRRFLRPMRSLGAKVAHWVTPKMEGNFAPLNWKTLDEWKQLCAPDYVVQRGASEVF